MFRNITKYAVISNVYLLLLCEWYSLYYQWITRSNMFFSIESSSLYHSFLHVFETLKPSLAFAANMRKPHKSSRIAGIKRVNKFIADSHRWRSQHKGLRRTILSNTVSCNKIHIVVTRLMHGCWWAAIELTSILSPDPSSRIYIYKYIVSTSGRELNYHRIYLPYKMNGIYNMLISCKKKLFTSN